jgi:hypothetical protein
MDRYTVERRFRRRTQRVVQAVAHRGRTAAAVALEELACSPRPGNAAIHTFHAAREDRDSGFLPNLAEGHPGLARDSGRGYPGGGSGLPGCSRVRNSIR